MFCILLLLLIPVSIDSHTTNQTDWCQHIHTNGKLKDLGIYHRFRNGEGEGDYVMYNRAGAEWLFNITFDGSDEYGIKWLKNTIEYIEDEGIVHRFGLYSITGKLNGKPYSAWQYCSVRQRVKIKFLYCFLQLKIVFNLGPTVQH